MAQSNRRRPEEQQEMSVSAPIRDRLHAVTDPLAGQPRAQVAEPQRTPTVAIVRTRLGRTIAVIPCDASAQSHIIGRGDDADIRLVDQCVHRQHARIRWDEGAGSLVIDDLGGVNGTFLNGLRVTASKPLTDGIVIRLGRVSLSYEVVPVGSESTISQLRQRRGNMLPTRILHTAGTES